MPREGWLLMSREGYVQGRGTLYHMYRQVQGRGARNARSPLGVQIFMQISAKKIAK